MFISTTCIVIRIRIFILFIICLACSNLQPHNSVLPVAKWFSWKATRSKLSWLLSWLAISRHISSIFTRNSEVYTSEFIGISSFATPRILHAFYVTRFLHAFYVTRFLHAFYVTGCTKSNISYNTTFSLVDFRFTK